MAASQVEGFSIIVPTFQEARNIPILIDKIAEFVVPATPFEVLLMDDNSADGTKEIVKKLHERYPWLKLIERKGSRNWSKAVLEGLQQAQFPNLVFMDADLSHPPEVIPEMVTLLQQGKAELVIGSRHTKGGRIDQTWPFYRRMISRIATLPILPLMPMRIKDPLSGFIAVRKSSYARNGNSWDPIGAKLGLEIIVKSNIKNIIEIPIYFAERKIGASKLVSMKMAVNYLKQIHQLWHYKLFNRWRRKV